MYYVEASGTPYEIGYQTGQATRLAVASTLDLMTKQFRHWDEARFRRARERHMAYTEKRCPELVEEVAGLADGAGIPFRWAYLANFYASMRAGHEGCSNFIFTETPDGPLLAKTNDLPAHEGKHGMVRLIRPKGGMSVLSTPWIGTVWRGSGMNEAGLAIGGSSCSTQVPQPEEFMNPHAVSGTVLARAETVEDAVALLGSLVVSSWGGNFALVDRTGAAAIVEKAGTLQGVRRATEARLWCANHALTPELSAHRVENPPALAESRERYEAIDRLTREAPLTADLARSVMAYNGRPGALCRYGDDDPLRYETEFAALFAPARGFAEFCFSHADRDPWHRFSLTG